MQPWYDHEPCNEVQLLLVVRRVLRDVAYFVHLFKSALFVLTCALHTFAFMSACP